MIDRLQDTLSTKPGDIPGADRRNAFLLLLSKLCGKQVGKNAEQQRG